MKLARPEPLPIEMEDGRKYLVPAPTRAQVREALRVEVEHPGTGTAEMDARVALQLKALVGDRAVRVDDDGQPIAGEKALNVEELTGDQERELLWALLAMHGGQDPASAVAVHRALKKKAIEMAAIAAEPSGGSRDSIETPSDLQPS